MTQLKAKFEGLETYDVSPSTLPDVLAERPVLLYGKYKGDVKGQISVVGYSGDRVHTEVLNVAEYKPSPKNSAIRYLWAREKIRLLDDYGAVVSAEVGKEEVTKLGLEYNLLTAYTSFIAVDSRVVKKNGKLVRVKQAVPMPENVENSAVGFDFGIVGLVKAKSAKAYDPAPKLPATAKIYRIGQIEISLPPTAPANMETWLKANLYRIGSNNVNDAGTNAFTVQLVFKADGSLANVKVRGTKVEFARMLQASIMAWPALQLPAAAARKYNLPVKINSL